MTWEQALQSLLVMGSGIGAWFLYDLVKEFKEFKRESGRDISSLKKEREVFQHLVRSSEVTIQARIQELTSAMTQSKTQVELGLGIVDNELTRVRYSIERAQEKANKFDEFMKNSYKLSFALNEKCKVIERELSIVKEKFHL